MGIGSQQLIGLYDDLNAIENEDLSTHCNRNEDYLAKLSLIIEAKINQPELQSVVRSLYVDIKIFIFRYTIQERDKEYGYDRLSTDVIDRVLIKAPLTDEKKYVLLEFFEDHANKLCFNKGWISREKNKLRLRIAKRRSFVKYILLLSSESIWSILLTLLILFAVECIVLSPTSIPLFQLFSLEPIHLSDSGFFNHVSNVLSLHLGIIEGPTLAILNPVGAIVMAFWQFLWIVLVVNILFRNLLTHLDINESES